MFLKAIFLIIIVGQSMAGEFQFNGQFSAWSSFDMDNLDEPWLGARYLPTFSAQRPLKGAGILDGEMAFNLHGSAFYEEGWDTDGDGDLYRLWLRYASNQLEVRLGLQKINFGSATLLRPLMWFDSVDPRDPLALTDGVYGILARRYFLNNANLWIWGLYGNDDPKGWEVLPTVEDRPELGGRFQFPLGRGELGLTFHHRRIQGGSSEIDDDFGEDRYGFDGKWDIGVGFWLEAAVIHQDLPEPTARIQRLVNIGCDYTFGLGSGLTALGEVFSYDTADEFLGKGEGTVFSALSLSYPFGVLDMLTAMVYFEWEGDQWYRFFNWQRTYDRWSFHAMVFWNPDEFQLYQGEAGVSRFSGRGFQLMVVFDH